MKIQKLDTVLFICVIFLLFNTACGSTATTSDNAEDDTEKTTDEPSNTENVGEDETETVDASDVLTLDEEDDNTRTIGGVVSGLNGTLTLTLNGSEELIFTTSDDFTFASEIPIASSYTVAILDSPALQNCDLTGGAGAIVDSDVTDVTVLCTDKAWNHPDDLSDFICRDEFDAEAPQVAMDDNGNAIIVWRQSDGINDQIFMSEYRDGSWNHPDSLSDNISPDGSSADHPQVAMDNDGNAIIVWQQENDDSDDQIFMSEYRNGSWSYPNSLSDNISPDGEDVYAPEVSMDDNGNAIIVWRQSDGSNIQNFMSEYRNGSWSHPNSLSDNISPDGESTGDLHVSMDDNGNAIIVWRQSDGINDQIFMSEYRNGSWNHPNSLSDFINPVGSEANNPQVAMSNDGNAILVWQQKNDSLTDQIFMSEYRNGSWDHPNSLSDYISSAPDSGVNEPKAAMDDNGNAIIIWEQYDDLEMPQIFMSEYRDGIWDHPNDLSDNISPDGSEAEIPQVAMDSNGSAVIVWKQYVDGADYQIFMSEYRDGVWDHPDSLLDNINPIYFGVDNPQVAMDDNSNAILVWQQFDSGTEDGRIFMSEFR